MFKRSRTGTSCSNNLVKDQFKKTTKQTNKLKENGLRTWKGTRQARRATALPEKQQKQKTKTKNILLNNKHLLDRHLATRDENKSQPPRTTGGLAGTQSKQSTINLSKLEEQKTKLRHKLHGILEAKQQTLTFNTRNLRLTVSMTSVMILENKQI